MDRKEKKIDLHEVFNEPDRRLLLFKFDALVRHLSLERADGCCCRLSGGQCHDINQVVTIIIERHRAPLLMARDWAQLTPPAG